MDTIDLEADLRLRIHVCAQRMRQNLEARASAVGLNLVQLAALHALLHARGQGLSPADLARQLGVSRGCSSKIARGLELAGYTEIVPDRYTPYFKSIHLTPDGLAAYRVANAALFESSLTREELLSLYPLLDRLEVPTRARQPRKRPFSTPGQATNPAFPVIPPNTPSPPKTVSARNTPSPPKTVSAPNTPSPPKTVSAPNTPSLKKTVSAPNTPSLTKAAPASNVPSEPTAAEPPTTAHRRRRLATAMWANDRSDGRDGATT